MVCKDIEPSIIQENRILRLCKRLDKFSFEDILTIADDVDESGWDLFSANHLPINFIYTWRKKYGGGARSLMLVMKI